MLKLGEIKRASEVGYAGRSRFIWDACPDCGRVRWQYLRLKGTRCQLCASQQHARRQTPITFIGVGVPQIGDTAQAKVLGYAGRGVMVFAPCSNCGKGHWVRPKDKNKVCVHCVPKVVGSNHPRWSGGYRIKRGYVIVHLEKGDPMRVMSDRNGWVLEHRLVVAHRIGRPLRLGEIVHHINGIKPDNRDSNLRLLIEREHNSHLVTKELQSRMCDLEARVISLEAENVLLRIQLGSMLIPSQAGEESLGVCRDLTGDTLRNIEGEEKVHSLEKSGGRSA